jgi:glutamate mutase epsilon subunit
MNIANKIDIIDGMHVTEQGTTQVSSSGCRVGVLIADSAPALNMSSGTHNTVA